MKKSGLPRLSGKENKDAPNRRSLIAPPRAGLPKSTQGVASLVSPTDQPDITDFGPKSQLVLGDRVSISGVKLGTVRYVGKTHFAKGEWCGIELDDAEGKHDGDTEGTRYFTCPHDHGIFAPCHKVTLVSPEISPASSDSTLRDRSPSPDKASRLPQPKTRGRNTSPDYPSESSQPPQKIKKTSNLKEPQQSKTGAREAAGDPSRQTAKQRSLKQPLRGLPKPGFASSQGVVACATEDVSNNNFDDQASGDGGKMKKPRSLVSPRVIAVSGQSGRTGNPNDTYEISPQDLDSDFPMVTSPSRVDPQTALTLAYDLDHDDDCVKTMNRTFACDDKENVMTSQSVPDLLTSPGFGVGMPTFDEAEMKKAMRDIMTESQISTASSLGILSEQELMDNSLLAEDLHFLLNKKDSDQEETSQASNAPSETEVDLEIAGIATPEIASISSTDHSAKDNSSPEPEVTEHSKRRELDLNFDLNPVTSTSPDSPVKTNNMAGEKMASPVKSDAITMKLAAASSVLAKDPPRTSDPVLTTESLTASCHEGLGDVVVKRDKSSARNSCASPEEGFPKKIRTSADLDEIDPNVSMSASIELTRTAVAQYASLMQAAHEERVVSEIKRRSQEVMTHEDEPEEEEDDDEEEEEEDEDDFEDAEDFEDKVSQELVLQASFHLKPRGVSRHSADTGIVDGGEKTSEGTVPEAENQNEKSVVSEENTTCPMQVETKTEVICDNTQHLHHQQQQQQQGAAVLSQSMCAAKSPVAALSKIKEVSSCPFGSMEMTDSMFEIVHQESEMIGARILESLANDDGPRSPDDLMSGPLTSEPPASGSVMLESVTSLLNLDAEFDPHCLDVKMETEEHQLIADLRAGHARNERPTSLVSSCSADTGIVTDGVTVEAADARERPVSIISTTSSVDTGYNGEQSDGDADQGTLTANTPHPPTPPDLTPQQPVPTLLPADEAPLDDIPHEPYLPDAPSQALPSDLRLIEVPNGVLNKTYTADEVSKQATEVLSGTFCIPSSNVVNQTYTEESATAADYSDDDNDDDNDVDVSAKLASNDAVPRLNQTYTEPPPQPLNLTYTEPCVEKAGEACRVELSDHISVECPPESDTNLIPAVAEDNARIRTAVDATAVDIAAVEVAAVGESVPDAGRLQTSPVSEHQNIQTVVAETFTETLDATFTKPMNQTYSEPERLVVEGCDTRDALCHDTVQVDKVGDQVDDVQVNDIQVDNVQVDDVPVDDVPVDDVQVGTAQVGDAQVGDAQVGDAQVGDAHIPLTPADEALVTPQPPPQPLSSSTPLDALDSLQCKGDIDHRPEEPDLILTISLGVAAAAATAGVDGCLSDEDVHMHTVSPATDKLDLVDGLPAGPHDPVTPSDGLMDTADPTELQAAVPADVTTHPGNQPLAMDTCEDVVMAEPVAMETIDPVTLASDVMSESTVKDAGKEDILKDEQLMDVEEAAENVPEPVIEIRDKPVKIKTSASKDARAPPAKRLSVSRPTGKGKTGSKTETDASNAERSNPRRVSVAKVGKPAMEKTETKKAGSKIGSFMKKPAKTKSKEEQETENQDIKNVKNLSVKKDSTEKKTMTVSSQKIASLTEDKESKLELNISEDARTVEAYPVIASGGGPPGKRPPTGKNPPKSRSVMGPPQKIPNARPTGNVPQPTKSGSLPKPATQSKLPGARPRGTGAGGVPRRTSVAAPPSMSLPKPSGLRKLSTPAMPVTSKLTLPSRLRASQSPEPSSHGVSRQSSTSDVSQPDLNASQSSGMSVGLEHSTGSSVSSHKKASFKVKSSLQQRDRSSSIDSDSQGSQRVSARPKTTAALPSSRRSIAGPPPSLPKSSTPASRRTSVPTPSRLAPRTTSAIKPPGRPSASSTPLKKRIPGAADGSTRPSKPQRATAAATTAATTAAASSPSVKRAHQPDVVTTATTVLNENARAAAEIRHLTSLCERRTQQLSVARSEVRQGGVGMEAMLVLIHYLTAQLEAFSTPHLKARLSKVLHDLKIAQEQLEELKKQKDSLIAEIQLLKQDHYTEVQQLRSDHQRALESQEERLRQDTDKQIKAAHEKHSHEVQTLKLYHEKDLLEKQQEHEEAVHAMEMKHTEQLQQEQQDHEDILNELQKKHETQLEEITMRFESIRVTLSEKMDYMRNECEELRRREKSIIDSCQRETEYKVQQALSPYKLLPAEIESLRAVLELRNQEIHDLRRQKNELLKELEQLPPARDKIKSLEQEKENLQAIIELRGDYEKQLAEKHQILLRRYEREAKANKRLSMDNEELAYRLSTGETGASSPDLMRRSISHSPTNVDIHPEHHVVMRRKKSPLPPPAQSPRSPRSPRSNSSFSDFDRTPNGTPCRSPPQNGSSLLQTPPKTNLRRSGTYDLLDQEFDEDMTLEDTVHESQHES